MVLAFFVYLFALMGEKIHKRRRTLQARVLLKIEIL